MRCPLCQAPLTENDRRCPRCDALLERLPFTSLNLKDSPADIPDPAAPEVADTHSTKAELGGDARIVGELGGDFASWSGSGEWTPHEDALYGLTAEDYLGAVTGVVERTFARPEPLTQVYVDENVARLLRPEAVLGLVPGDDGALSPFERHVSSFLDGSRPLVRVARKANLSLDDARIALALLVDKKRAVLVGHLIIPERFREPPRTPPPTESPKAKKAPPPLPPDAVDESPAVRPPMRPPMRPQPEPAAPARTSMRPPPAPEPPPPPREAPFRPFDPSRKPPPPGARYGAQQDVRLLKLAMQKEEAGLYDEAVRLLRKAIEVSPDAAVLYNRLGVVLATRMKDYAAAAEVLFQACELEPNNDTYMSNLAKVAERSEAERAAEQANRATFRGGLFRRRR